MCFPPKIIVIYNRATARHHSFCDEPTIHRFVVSDILSRIIMSNADFKSV